MADQKLKLEWIEGEFAICQLGHNSLIPPWVINSSGLTSITRTHDETSVIAPTDLVPEGIKAERGYVAMRVAGKLEFDVVGVLAKLTCALAADGVPVFTISTFDTDYLLIRKDDAEIAIQALDSVASIETPAFS